MNIFFRLLAVGCYMLSFQIEALENPKFVFSETAPNKGSLLIKELDFNGKVAFQNIELELDFSNSTFNLKKLENTNENFTTPQLESVSGGVNIIDSWVSSGGRNQSSFRNHHFVFDVIQNGEVSINIESSVSNYLYLINSLGFLVVEGNNKITKNLPIGTYTIVAATVNFGEGSNYTLAIQGAIDSTVKKINSRRIEKVGNWASSGGRIKESFRNKHFLFDVSSDSYIDITIESGVSNYLYLINSLGFVVTETSGNRLTADVPADSYKLVVATINAGESSNYVLTVVGEFGNLVEEKSNVVESVGSWVSSGGRDRNSINNPSYSFELIEKSLVDITIISSVSNYLYLIDNLNNVVKEMSGNRLTVEIPAGQYKLVAATISENESSNFVLTIYGKFNNFFKN